MLFERFGIVVKYNFVNDVITLKISLVRKHRFSKLPDLKSDVILTGDQFVLKLSTYTNHCWTTYQYIGLNTRATLHQPV